MWPSTDAMKGMTQLAHHSGTALQMGIGQVLNRHVIVRETLHDVVMIFFATGSFLSFSYFECLKITDHTYCVSYSLCCCCCCCVAVVVIVVALIWQLLTVGQITAHQPMEAKP